MLTYNFEARGNFTRYDYLYRCIKQDVLSGRITAGERLPSKRSLARHLELAVVTVEHAYSQLEAEGYLVARQRQGYFVCAVEAGGPPPQPPWQEQRVTDRSAPVADLKNRGAGGEGFPFSVWAKLMRRVLTEQGALLLRPVEHNGVPELRRAIARHLYQFRGIAASPEQIVVGAGTEYLYNLIVQLLGRDEVYGVEDPGYDKAARVYELSGARCEFLPMDGQGVDPGIVEQRRVQVLHLSPNHQFPTGAVTPIARRQGLLRWACQEINRYIIEDDYDSEFRFAGRPIPALQSIDQWDKVIYMNTFSRSLAPSLRIAYMVLPWSLLDTYRQKLGFYSCTVPAIEQYTLAQFLEQGHFDSHISRMRVFYKGRRDAAQKVISTSPLAGRCSIAGEQAGLHFLLRLDTGVTDDDLAARAKERGIRLSFVSDYQRNPDSHPGHTLVINYPGIDLDHLTWTLEVLADLL